MMIYVWKSNMLMRWALGHILVAAEGIEEARAKAYIDGEKYIRCEWDYDDETIAEKLGQLKDDLRGVPETHETLFLKGSE